MANADVHGQDDVLTLAETARHLKLAEKTVLRMVHRGELPGARIGSQWRFLRSVLDEWLMSKMSGGAEDALTRLVSEDEGLVPLSRLVRKDTLIPELAARSREEVLNQMAERLVRIGYIGSALPYVGKLLERETMASTYIGHETAVPHQRRPQENPSGDPVVVVATSSEPVQFGAPGGETVRLFFLVSTRSEVAHLRILHKIAIFARNKAARSALIAAETPEQMLQAILQNERS